MKSRAYKALTENEKHAHKILAILVEFNNSFNEVKWIYEAALDKSIYLNDLECVNVAKCSPFDFKTIRKYFYNPKQKSKKPLPADLLTVWNYLRDANDSNIMSNEQSLINLARMDVKLFYKSKPEQEKNLPDRNDLLNVWDLLHEANDSLDIEIEEILTAKAKRNVNEFYKD